MLSDIESDMHQYIDNQYSIILNRYKEFEKSTKENELDVTILLTKKNFFIIGLAACVENIHEQLFSSYIENYFEEMKKSGMSLYYCNYEKNKFLNIINKLHSSKRDIFLQLADDLFGIRNKLKALIKNNDKKNILESYKGIISDLAHQRDLLAHRTDYYFIKGEDTWDVQTEREKKITVLRESQKILVSIIYGILKDILK